MSLLSRTAAMGLGAAVAVVLVLTSWLHAGVTRDLAGQQAEREAVLLTMAVTGSLADVAQEEDRPALAARLALWVSSGDRVLAARVISGRELVASTAAADAAPRTLQREEKPLFDLANELRAAGETNTGEGSSRKKTVRSEDHRDGTRTVSVPWVVDGAVQGMVQATVRSRTGLAAAGASTGWGWLAGLLAAGLAVGALLRVDGPRRFDLPRLAAVGVFAVLVIAFQQHLLGAMEDRLQQSETQVGQLQSEALETFTRATVGADDLPIVTATGASVWDVDGFGRPRSTIDAGGERLPRAAPTAEESHAAFLRAVFWGLNALGLAVLLFFVQGYARRTVAALREHAAAYAYVAPAMIGMLVLVFFPFFYGISLAFTDTTLFNENLPFRERWVGLDNFFAILGDFDIVTTTEAGTVWNYQNFYWTLMVTVIWTVTNVTVGVTFGFLLALALNTEGLRGKTIYRILLILPWAIPNYITALVWRGMFHPQFGVINQVLQMFGMEPVRWFDGVVSSFMTGLITNGWLSFPFMMVVILGALQSIPRDMYEAAEVEGASRWQQLKSITLPLLRPTLVPAIVLSVVWTFNMFNIIFLVSGGEPGGANEILITKAYKIAFEQYQYAYAAAYSTVIFIILLVYGYFQTRITRATESY
jgi:arabinogalactan oligomer / maltooligosaccharide transport system permease protein